MIPKPKQLKNSSIAALLTPYSLWALFFVLVPLAFVGFYAFTDDAFKFTTANITRFFTATSNIISENNETTQVRTYILISLRSLKLAAISTVICFLIGYPFAYSMSRANPKAQKTMITLIMIPMWTNFLIRTYAWMTILQDSGVLNTLLGKLNLFPLHIIGTETAVIIGMVYDYLPFMIFPIYSVLTKLDYTLIEAARDLGCSYTSILKRVIFPLSLPGVLSGINMVLIPSVSTFYISQKLGSGKFFLIGDAIEGQYVSNNLHFAAAIAFILMIALLICMAIIKRLTMRMVQGGGAR